MPQPVKRGGGYDWCLTDGLFWVSLVDMTLTVSWNDLTAKQWDAFLKKAPCPIYMQHDYAYGAAMQKYGARAFYGTIRQRNTVVGLIPMLYYRLLGIIPITINFKGVIWISDVKTEDKINFYRRLPRHRPVRRSLFIIDEAYNESYLKMAKYRRVITGAYSVWIDLSLEIKTLRKNLHVKWRNQLRKAQKVNLKIDIQSGANTDFQWILAADRIQQQKRHYWALPRPFIHHYINQSKHSNPIVITATKNNERVAGMLFLIHGNSATYHVGWTNDIGRKANTHNALLWDAIQYLKLNGIQWLNLDSINTDDLSGITRFKIRTGGQIVSSQGSFMPFIFRH